MSELKHQLDEIAAAIEELRIAGDSPHSRKQLDSIFRRVHNLKAAASADGLHDLSHVAHELENVLHALRTGRSTLDDNVLQQLTETSAALSEILPSNSIPEEIWNGLKAEEKHSLTQSVKEGANLFLVQTSFDVSEFDLQFQKLKETLSSSGELISVAPKVESKQKINFRILYARTAEASQISNDVTGIPGVTVEPLLQSRNSLNEILQRAVRAGSAAALATGKDIDFELRGATLSLEKSVPAAIGAPLLHLVRNAVDHGIESPDQRLKAGKNPRGKIIIEAARFPGQLTITVSDDGRGIAPGILTAGRLFEPGFSTAAESSEISGRGVGLDAVKTTIEEMGGTVSVSSELSEGSAFEITVPV